MLRCWHKFPILLCVLDNKFLFIIIIIIIIIIITLYVKIENSKDQKIFSSNDIGLCVSVSSVVIPM